MTKKEKPWWQEYKVDVPEGESGKAMVYRFRVSEKDAAFHNLREAINPGRGSRLIYPGEYTALKVGGQLWMSDTPAEIADHLDAIWMAKGDCLVTGLGLGVVVRAMLLKSDVDSVTVIERNADVITLVANHYQRQFGDRLRIVQNDAFTWKPPRGARYQVVWHDIWSDICADNLPEMQRLHRRYGRRAKWQGSWARHLCRKLALTWLQ